MIALIIIQQSYIRGGLISKSRIKTHFCQLLIPRNVNEIKLFTSSEGASSNNIKELWQGDSNGKKNVTFKFATASLFLQIFHLVRSVQFFGRMPELHLKKPYWGIYKTRNRNSVTLFLKTFVFFFRTHHCQSSLLNDEQAEDKNVFLAEAIQHLPSPPVDANCTLFFRWRGFHGYRLILVVERFLKSYKKHNQLCQFKDHLSFVVGFLYFF